MKAIEYTCYNVKVWSGDGKQTYMGSVYGADLNQMQAVKVAMCLNQMFAERGQGWYADTEAVED
jgi:hypothetical protein